MGAGSLSVAFKLTAMASMFCTAIPGCWATCGDGRPLDSLSQEAWKLVLQQEIRKSASEAAIDAETAQILLSRLFDLDTGKPLALPAKRKAQYSSDAKLFAQYLREMAAAAEARKAAVLDRMKACDGVPTATP